MTKDAEPLFFLNLSKEFATAGWTILFNLSRASELLKTRLAN